MSTPQEHIASLLAYGAQAKVDSVSLLHHAVLANSPLAVSALLNAGALPVKDVNGITPLHLAAAMGESDICKKIAVAYPNERFVCTPSGLNSADFAMLFNHPELLAVLGRPNQGELDLSTSLAAGERPRT